VIIAVAALAAFPAVNRDPGGEREPPPQAAGRATGQDGDGPEHTFAAAAARGRLRFELVGLHRATIVAAWLRARQGSHRLSASVVARGARRGTFSVPRPRGWAARSTQLVVRTAAQYGVYGCGFGSFGAGTWPPGCWRPYSAASPFNRPLPAAPRLAANSQQVVAWLLGLGPIEHLQAGLADTPGDYGHPTYYSQPRDPLFRLHCYQKSWGTCGIEGDAIRIPDAARPAAGQDRHLAVVDQDSGWEYDLYKVRSKPRGGGLLVFRWGGRTRIDGLGLGSGATAARFGNLAGVIRAAELAYGRIDHALFLTVHCDSGRYVYPAGGSGRSCAQLGRPTADAPPMGTRLQLAMSPLQIDALAVPGWKKTILRAMATYGMFVGDTGGGSWGPQLESSTTFTSFGAPDPLLSFARRNDWQPYGGVWVGNLRDGVNWARYLRVIAPCVSHGTC
jgi:hypothetical protein